MKIEKYLLSLAKWRPLVTLAKTIWESGKARSQMGVYHRVSGRVNGKANVDSFFKKSSSKGEEKDRAISRKS